MRTITYYLSLLSVSLLVSNARSQDRYVTFYSGGVFLGDYNGEEEVPPPLPPPPAVPPTPTIFDRNGTFNDGWLIGAAAGKCVWGTRFEGEFFYRNTTGDIWTVTPNIGAATSTPWSGQLNCYSSMVNAIRDIPFTKLAAPYIGAGIGVAVLDGELDTATEQFEITDTEFAFQGIAGVRTQLTETLSLMTEYRYFGATSATLRNRTTLAPIDDFNYSAHNVLFGIQIAR